MLRIKICAPIKIQFLCFSFLLNAYFVMIVWISVMKTQQFFSQLLLNPCSKKKKCQMREREPSRGLQLGLHLYMQITLKKNYQCFVSLWEQFSFLSPWVWAQVSSNDTGSDLFTTFIKTLSLQKHSPPQDRKKGEIRKGRRCG